jgi:hypothetical protein
MNKNERCFDSNKFSDLSFGFVIFRFSKISFSSLWDFGTPGFEVSVNEAFRHAFLSNPRLPKF